MMQLRPRVEDEQQLSQSRQKWGKGECPGARGPAIGPM